MIPHPAILVVPGREPDDESSGSRSTYSYTDINHLPPENEVRDVVVEALEEVWGNPADMIRGIYGDEVKIQHETPPAEPYDAYAVVVEFAQLPVNKYDGRVTNEDPFRMAQDALAEEYGVEIEMWIDATAGSGSGGSNA